MIRAPLVTVLHVVDQVGTAIFLEEMFGWRRVTDLPDPQGRRWIELEGPSAETRVAVAATDPAVVAALEASVGRMAHGWFSCDDLDETCRELRERGVRFTVDPQPTPWRSDARWAQIAGPAGAYFGLMERG